MSKDNHTFKMDCPLITIVIPVYNRGKTLHYCIDSVLSQTYQNWELILVDDGSSDSSSQICKEYAETDKRIKCFYQNNQGAGPARNKGIQEAAGDWISFLDSDDAIMPDHLLQVVKYGGSNDLVMVNHCHARYINGKLTKQDEYWKGIGNTQVSGNEDIIDFIFSKMNPYKYFIYCCWDKFFRRDIIERHNLLYPTDIPTGQDMYFVINYFKYTKNFYYSCEGTYAQTPMGNEAIEHLAWRLRPPKEYFHCHLRNYKNLLDLYHISHKEIVRNYAIHYVLTDTFVRIIPRYTNWRNRRILGKKDIVDFMNRDFRPLIDKLADSLDCVKNDLYRHQLKLILEGKSEAVYDYWFYKNLKQAFARKVKHLLK